MPATTFQTTRLRYGTRCSRCDRRAGGMLVTPPRPLIRRLGRDGPLTYGRRRAVAVALAAALPPA